ncbi:MAG TPA: YncE family protein, partial [Thermoplasmata archaeon]|nr:YncE family protein [Thermoplasmata archaeon]
PGARAAYGVVATIQLGSAPYGSVFDGGTSQLFVSQPQGNDVSVVSTVSNSVVRNVTVGTQPEGVAYDPGKGAVFVTNNGSGTVSVVADSNDTVVATIPVGNGPTGAAYDPVRGEVFVTNFLAGTVSILSDANDTLVGTVAVGSGPGPIVYDGAKGEMFVANEYSSNVSVIADANRTVVASVPVGLGPFGEAYDPAKGELFIVNAESDNVSILTDANNTLVGSVPVGSSPVGPAYDPARGRILVPNYGSGNVSVISDSTDAGVGSVRVGSNPWGAVYAASNQEIYVGNRANDTLSVLSASTSPPTYSVEFTETGLPSGTNWSVTLNGSVAVSATSTIEFSETDGAYAYSVGAVPGFRAAPDQSNLTVNNSAIATVITFTATTRGAYAVTFQESGLASGTSWSVTLAGSTRLSATNVVQFVVPNGSRSYTVNPVVGYRIGAPTGTVDVAGGPRAVPVLFTENGSAAQFAVTFTESGLISGTNWSVTIGLATTFGIGGSVTLPEANGSYTYVIGTVPGYRATPTSGPLTVNGTAVTVPVTFATGSGAPPKTGVGTPLLDYAVVAVVIILVVAAILAMAAPVRSGPPPTTPTRRPATGPPKARATGPRGPESSGRPAAVEVTRSQTVPPDRARRPIDNRQPPAGPSPQ